MSKRVFEVEEQSLLVAASPAPPCASPDEPSDDENALANDAPRRRAPLLFAGVLVVGCLSAALWWSTGAAPSERPSELSSPGVEVEAEEVEEPAGERLLTSDRLTQLAVKHALAFGDASDEEIRNLSPQERGDLSEQLVPQALAQIQSIAKRVASVDPEAGRKLAELRLTDEQWGHTETLLEALHDHRVQDIGRYVKEAAHSANGDRAAVAAKLGERSDEMRKLASELIPSKVRDVPKFKGQAQWELAVGKQGELEGHGRLGEWDASVEFRPASPRETLATPAPIATSMTATTTTCGLQANWQSQFNSQQLLKSYAGCLKDSCVNQDGGNLFANGSTTCDTLVYKNHMEDCTEKVKADIELNEVCPVTCGTCQGPWSQLYKMWFVIGSLVASIIALVCTILTMTLGPGIAAIIWIIHASLSGLLCGTSVGLMWMPLLKHAGTWVPCIILSAFAGIESVWTFAR